FTERGPRKAGESYLFATVFHGDAKAVAKPGSIGVLAEQAGAEVKIGDAILQIQTGEKGIALRLGDQAWRVNDSDSVEISQFETAPAADVPVLALAVVPSRD